MKSSFHGQNLHSHKEWLRTLLGLEETTPEVFSEAYSRLLKMARQKAGRGSEPEDLAQETLRVLHEKALKPRFKGLIEEKPEGYLRTIIKRAIQTAQGSVEDENLKLYANAAKALKKFLERAIKAGKVSVTGGGRGKFRRIRSNTGSSSEGCAGADEILEAIRSGLTRLGADTNAVALHALERLAQPVIEQDLISAVLKILPPERVEFWDEVPFWLASSEEEPALLAPDEMKPYAEEFAARLDDREKAYLKAKLSGSKDGGDGPKDKEIAKSLGISAPTMSRVRASFEEKFRAFCKDKGLWDEEERVGVLKALGAKGL